MPERTCIGCRRKRPQPELVRVVRLSEEELAISRTAPGRGAWLCVGSAHCIDLAGKRKAFGRAFKAPVSEAAAQQLRSHLRSP